MAVENGILDTTLSVSGNDLSAATDQYLMVKIGATDGDVVPGTAGDATIGVNQDTGIDNAGISVRVSGISKFRAGATITQGQALNSNATGNAVPHLGDLNFAGGIAWEAAATSDVFTGLIIHSGYSSNN